MHIAASNVDATLIAAWLTDHGLEAYAVEDNSPVGTYMLGTNSVFHKPMVYVKTDQVDDAKRFVEEYLAKPETDTDGGVDSFYYHCGAKTNPNDQQGASCGENLDAEAEPNGR